MGKIKIKVLFISIVIPLSAGFLGSIFTTPAIGSWYAYLNKPSWNPPNWLFGPVWTTLYILMGVSLYLIITQKVDKEKKKKAYTFYTTQLILNFLWSIIFFGFKNPSVAFFEIIFLWLSTVITIYYFYKINRTSAYLLVPYILWVSFASFLNFTVMNLN